MKAVFEREYSVRLSDFDRNMKLSAASILNLFQDAAGYHAEALGMGFDSMFERNYAWILTRVKFQILKNVKRYENIKVKTWQLEPQRRSFQREYLIESLTGDKIAHGTSEWVVMNIERRRPVLTDEVYQKELGGYCDIKVFGDEQTIKVERFEAEDTPFILTPGISALDINDHVNNARYADFVTDAMSLSLDEHIDTFQIDYHREVKEGVELNIFKRRIENEILIKGENNAGELMFLCRVNVAK